jgi:hypothetical protein
LNGVESAEDRVLESSSARSEDLSADVRWGFHNDRELRPGRPYDQRLTGEAETVSDNDQKSTSHRQGDSPSRDLKIADVHDDLELSADEIPDSLSDQGGVQHLTPRGQSSGSLSSPPDLQFPEEEEEIAFLFKSSHKHSDSSSDIEFLFEGMTPKTVHGIADEDSEVFFSPGLQNEFSAFSRGGVNSSG